MTVTAPTWKGHPHMVKVATDERVVDFARRCDCTGGGSSDLASWNGTSGKRWNRFLQDLRRALGVEVQYFKAAEVQRRGALHFHVLAASPVGAPPLALSWEKLRQLAVKHGFGHEVDVQALTDRHEDRKGCPCVACRAGYVAKYASKAAASRPDVPWRGRRRFERLEGVDRVTGEVTGEVRLERGWKPSTRPTYRTWTASRRWGCTMREIRAAQGHHEAVTVSLMPWGAGRTVWPGEADACPRRPTCNVPARPPDGSPPPPDP